MSSVFLLYEVYVEGLKEEKVADRDSFVTVLRQFHSFTFLCLVLCKDCPKLVCLFLHKGIVLEQTACYF